MILSPPDSGRLARALAGMILGIGLALPASGQSSASAEVPLPLPDPAQDGWDSEAVQELVSAQWKALGELALSPETVSDADLLAILDPRVRVFPLAPVKPVAAYATGNLTLLRGEGQANAGESSTGAAFLLKELRALPGRVEGDASSPEARSSEWSFKNTSIALGTEGMVETTTLVTLATRAGNAAIEIHMVWAGSWRIDPASGLPVLLSLRSDASAYREAHREGKAIFEEATASVLRGAPDASRQFGEGFNQWSESASRFLGYNIYSRCGMAVGDANGDGLDDVYVCQPGGFPNRLLLQQPDGGVRDVSADSGLDILNESASALFVDLDNDGDQDLVLAARLLGLLLYRNEGGHRFVAAGELAAPADVQSLSAVDYDNDGHLDLYVCSYFNDDAVKNGQGLSSSFDEQGGGPNLLFRNLGAAEPWAFEDVTEATGLGDGNRSFSLGASWEDFDDDGDQDLYIANDFGTNRLYRNEGSRFTEIAAAAGVADFGAGMGVTWGDYDGDGRSDLYVANMFSSAGSRITGQRKFAELTRDNAVSREEFRRFAKGNSLFRNRGDGTFRETSAEQEVEVGRWAWSPLFGDINNDGRQDLLVTNGYITGYSSGDL